MGTSANLGEESSVDQIYCGVTSALADRGEDEEEFEPDTHHPGNESQGIADNRQPGKQKAPDTVFAEPGLAAVQRIRLEGKPAARLETRQESTQHPVDGGAQTITCSCHQPHP